MKILERLGWFTAVLLLTAGVLNAEVRIAPVPDGEPVSGTWSVAVNGESARVLTARTADPPFESYDYGGVYGIVSVDADEPVTFTVTEKSGRSLDALTIRPASLGLEAKNKTDHSFEVTVTKSCQFSVETNGRERPLLIFVNPPEKDVPSPDDPFVRWFGPGIHDPENGRIDLADNQTLYLAPGAIVRGGVAATGKNIRICGRGVIDSTPWKWPTGPTPHVVSLTACDGVAVEGVIVRGASRWTIVPRNCDNVTIENVKICGGRVQNDDGINPCNSRNVAIRDCFIRTDDDCIALKGLDRSEGNCEDIAVENCVFWCDRARIVLMGHESRAPFMRRITFRNCDIIHSQGRNFLMEPGEEMALSNLLFEKIRFEIGDPNTSPKTDADQRPETAGIRFDIDTGAKENWLFVGRPAVNQYMTLKKPGHIADCVLRDISVTGVPEYCGILFSGADAEHKTDGLTVEGMTLFGRPLEADSANVHLGDFLDRVEIR